MESFLALFDTGEENSRRKVVNNTWDDDDDDVHCDDNMKTDDEEEDRLPPEPEQGNIEYKLKLISPSSQRFEHLVTQMKWRLREGQGEAIYQIGKN